MLTELCDVHIHTAYRPDDDGSKDMTVAFLADYAQKHGYTEIGLTPHFGLDSSGKILCQIRSEIEDLETDICVLLGVEANFVDCGKTIAIDDSIRSQLDFIVGAADHFNWGDVEKPPLAFSDMIDYQHQKLLNIAKHPWVDMISHPWTGLMLLTTRGHLPEHPPLKRLSEVPESYFHEFAGAAAAGNTAVEVSGSYVHEYPLNEENPQEFLEDLARFYHILAEHEVALTISSDAHNPSDLANAKRARAFLNSIGLGSINLWYPGNS
jgi:histidinol phosphatase-like PHP family hydrolase